ncbi:MAG: hypothetical protein PHI86_06105 [Candidatus Omnitrophica bacterium]|nr:hypothetical protein [Candidatus Omnitrophota bacterium]HOX54470.1 hypothetical protein [Candidatus Omnitrophota bacterium]
MNLKTITCFVFLAAIFLSNNFLVFAYENVPAAIHIQTNISDGKYSFDEIAKQAQKENIKVLIFTDTALRRWEYGIRPLENIIKRRIEHSSVFKFGIAKYLTVIKNLKEKYPGMVFVPAVEVVPFYYWQGNFWEKDFTLYNWHKKMLVIGLENESDYRFLPIIANHSLWPLHENNFIKLWPLLIILLGIFLAIKYQNKTAYRNYGYVFLVIGVLFLANNLQFNVSRFNAYNKDQRTKPYQDLIDYVVKRGGLVFWAYPEVKNIDRVKGVNVCTFPYKEELIYTHDYTGSAVLFDENRSLANIGDVWDKILLASCVGSRAPAWAIGEVDYHGDHENLSRIQTVFLLNSMIEEEVFKALKKGMMYAKLNNVANDFNLDKFIVSDEEMKSFGLMGQEIEVDSKPEVIIETSCKSSPDEPIEIKLIRNGKLIQTFNSESSNFRVKYQDEYFSPGEKIYYRIMIKSGSNIYQVISNPIFVRFISK